MREYYSETVFKELLDSFETGNEEKIHYQDYNEDEALILNFYYDTLLCQGAGLDGGLEYEDAKEIYAFSLRGYKRQRWENEAFSIPELDLGSRKNYVYPMDRENSLKNHSSTS